MKQSLLANYHRLMGKLSTRKCRKGCTESGVHTHHLTAFGRWRFTRGITAADGVRINK